MKVSSAATGTRMVSRPPFFVLAPLLLALPSLSCAQKPDSAGAARGGMETVTSVDRLNDIVEKAGDRLLVFDLYADWCMPCKVLTPMLEEIAREQSDAAGFYRIDVDKNPLIAGAFGVQGIPYVVFVKNKAAVYALTGLQPRAAYVRSIQQYAKPGSKPGAPTPDGELVEGVRVIRLNTATAPGEIFVYRGETVKLIVENLDFAYSMHIPQYKISRDARKGENLKVSFKAEEVGVFPIYCNGDCPTGDGARFGQIVVMQHGGGHGAEFSEIDPVKAKALMDKASPLILDVRTPKEYYEGHIKGATLIPLQQLAGRLSEIERYKDKDVLVYCRSGNRSTVASEILAKAGFSRLHNLQTGIKGWNKEGYALEK